MSAGTICRDYAPGSGPVQYGSIAIASAGTTAIVAAVTGKRIRLLSLVLTVTGNGTVKFQSASNDISGAIPLLASTEFLLPENPSGWLQTNAAEALNLVLATSTACNGFFSYITV